MYLSYTTNRDAQFFIESRKSKNSRRTSLRFCVLENDALQVYRLLFTRGGVLEDVLGLEDTSSSPWPEASSSRKLLCPRLEDSTIFEWLKFCRSAEKCFSRPFFFLDRRKKNFKFFFLRKKLAFVSLVLGLDLGIFLCPIGLGLEPCVLDSTSAIYCWSDGMGGGGVLSMSLPATCYLHHAW